MLRDPVLVGAPAGLHGALQRALREHGGRCLLPDADGGLPPGPVVLDLGLDPAAPVRAWEVVDLAVRTARLLPALAGRRVVALTRAGGHPVDAAGSWADAVLDLAREPCPPARTAPLGVALVEAAGAAGSAADAVRLVARVAELLVAGAVPAPLLTVVRVGEVFGPGRPGLVERLVVRTLAGAVPAPAGGPVGLVHVDDLAALVAADPPAGALSGALATASPAALAGLVRDELVRCGAADPSRVPPGAVRLSAADEPAAVRVERQLRAVVRERAGSAAAPLAEPVPVVVPPRPERPDLVAARTAAALHDGVLRHGGPWTRRLERRLHEQLALGPDTVVLATSSGSAALRLAVAALAGPARPGDVAVLPSYTFAATAEVLRELGYLLRFCEVDPATWTLDPAALDRALAPGDVRLAVAVDALGCPADTPLLRAVAQEAGVPLLADSAPSLGARLRGAPVGGQAHAHAFSMSFAKVVSAGGAGGALVLPRADLERLRTPVDWTRSALMTEPAAVVALDQLERLEVLHARRTAVAAVYAELLADVPGVVPQAVRPGDRHALVHWAARVPGRDALVPALAALGVGTRAYYTPALHAHPWAGGAEPARLPVTEQLVDEVLALPMSSELTPERAEQVAVRVREALLSAAVWSAAQPAVTA